MSVSIHLRTLFKGSARHRLYYKCHRQQIFNIGRNNASLQFHPSIKYPSLPRATHVRPHMANSEMANSP